LILSQLADFGQSLQQDEDFIDLKKHKDDISQGLLVGLVGINLEVVFFREVRLRQMLEVSNLPLDEPYQVGTVVK
jgi:hypothetical protein